MDQEPPIEKVTIPAMMSTTAAVLKARELIYKAETLRREPNGSFKPSASVGKHPDSDWGVAAQLIRAAEMHLDESLPNGQKNRSQLALGAMIIGLSLLTRALNERGVDASAE